MGTGVETLFVDGKWAAADDGAGFDVLDPATGEVIGQACDAGPGETDRAIAAAAAAFPGWSAETAYTRSDRLSRAYRLMLERQDELAELLTREQGKPLRAARNEIGYAADFLGWFAEEAKRVYGSTIPSPRPGQRFTVLRQPVGVVAAITPWNYPVSMITRKLAPALAAGCTIVLKPAEQTPLCAVAVVRILNEAGIPPGVVNLVTTSRPEPVAERMLASAQVRKLTFTGSTAVGTELAARAAATMKRVSTELGGHAPMIVFDDADPVYAAKGAALAKFLNTGQACISPNRILVQRGIYRQFCAEFSARARALVAGPGMGTGTGTAEGTGKGPGEGAGTGARVGIGPLVDEQALAKVDHQVRDALARGARLLTGGHRLTDEGLRGGWFYAPTVLADVDPSMLIHREETFGPVAALMPFDDEAEAIAAANDTRYGLAGYVYTNDLGRATRTAEALRCGIVGINDINPTAAAAPFGGIGLSGVGREGGADGIDEYLDVKLVGQIAGPA